ncbi:MAG: protein BatD [Actinobacteria bacterium]|nr:MAG: protein BatD [Actinomycetota bacterium]
MTSALWVLMVLQGPALLLEARVDRSRLPAGEQLTLTVRARSRTAEPVGLTLPALTGFTIVGSREITEVSLDGTVGQLRTTTRELRLRTERAGTLVIGAVRARQGARAVATEPITIVVDSAALGPAAALSPRARGLLAVAPPPARSDRVALSVILPSDRDRRGVVPARASHAPAAYADSDDADPGRCVVVSRSLTQRAGCVAARAGWLDGPVRGPPDRVPARRGARDHPPGHGGVRGAGEFLVLQP